MSNKTVLQKGHRRAEMAIKAHLEAGCRYAAEKLLIKAVKDFNDESLTGNTITGFGAAVYIDGEIVGKPLTVFDVMNIKPPTHPYTFPGDSEFVDYSSGEIISKESKDGERTVGIDDTHVFQYSKDTTLRFQPTDKGYGCYDTYNWLMSYKPRKKGIAIIIANAVPYADYLRQEKEVNILDGIANSNIAGKHIFYRTKEIDFDDIVNNIKA